LLAPSAGGGTPGSTLVIPPPERSQPGTNLQPIEPRSGCTPSGCRPPCSSLVLWNCAQFRVAFSEGETVW